MISICLIHVFDWLMHWILNKNCASSSKIKKDTIHETIDQCMLKTEFQHKCSDYAVKWCSCFFFHGDRNVIIPLMQSGWRNAQNILAGTQKQTVEGIIIMACVSTSLLKPESLQKSVRSCEMSTQFSQTVCFNEKFEKMHAKHFFEKMQAKHNLYI